jgi:threonine dehydrogenase-like Zn-dependent dehydrogenase
MGAGLSQLVKVPARQAWSMGDAPEDHAVMGEPLACVAHSVRLSHFRAGDRVAIIGAGYMGRLHLALTRHGGASGVGMVDVSDRRLADASTSGATWVAAPDDAVAVGGQQDVVFVTAGAPGSFELALSLCDDGGTVIVYGAFPKDLAAPVSPDAIHHHELSVIGVYSQEPDDWRTSAGLIRSGALAEDLARLVTARFPLSDVAEAFQLVSTSPAYRVLVGRLAP